MFPALPQAWEDALAEYLEIADLVARWIALAGGREPADLPEAEKGRVAVCVPDLVEPARVTTREKLDERDRALAIAAR
jgi:hypothetical protein